MKLPMDMNLINEVKKIASRYHEALEPPCTEAKLEKLRERARAELATGIPGGYAEFLRIMDGLDFNGMSIYASEQTTSRDASRAEIFGFVETNLMHRDVDVMKNYLVFGGGTAWTSMFSTFATMNTKRSIGCRWRRSGRSRRSTKCSSTPSESICPTEGDSFP